LVPGVSLEDIAKPARGDGLALASWAPSFARRTAWVLPSASSKV